MTTNIADLAGVRAKLRRAKEHKGTLKTEFDIWAKQQADAHVFHIRRDGSWYIAMTESLKQPDIRFAVIAGDIVHNLRSALDHLVWQLVLRDGHEPSRWNEFPMCKSEELFFKKVKFRKSKPEVGVLYGITVDGDAWTIIEKAQPYVRPPNTESLIGVIGRLSIWDKHRTLYIQRTFVEDIRGAIGWNPEAILLEERISTSDLSFEKPTEVVRYRFADQPSPNVHVKGDLPIIPTFGEGEIKGGYQLSIGMFDKLITKVTKIVDEVSNLPRVIDIQS
jgi:hypothetical protein